jgi:alcohol dehydrogenase class IV
MGTSVSPWAEAAIKVAVEHSCGAVIAIGGGTPVVGRCKLTRSNPR